MKHSDQKQFVGGKGSLGLYFQVIVHYGGMSGQEFKQESEAESIEEHCFLVLSLTHT